jgi:hypothetical protein
MTPQQEIEKALDRLDDHGDSMYWAVGVPLAALIRGVAELSRLREAQASRVKKMQELAAQARKTVPGSREHRAIVAESKMGATVVTDYGTAIEQSILALMALVRAINGGEK